MVLREEEGRVIEEEVAEEVEKPGEFVEAEKEGELVEAEKEGESRVGLVGEAGGEAGAERQVEEERLVQEEEREREERRGGELGGDSVKVSGREVRKAKGEGEEEHIGQLA